MSVQQFRARLTRFEGVGTWMYVKVPFAAEKIFGRGGQIKVKGAINDVPFRSSLMPDGDGSHFLVISKFVRDKAKIKVGDRIQVFVEPDGEPRAIEAPPDLAKTLSKIKEAKAAWDSLSYSHRKAFVEWIVSAKKDETRKSRVEKAASMIAAKKPMK